VLVQVGVEATVVALAELVGRTVLAVEQLVELVVLAVAQVVDQLIVVGRVSPALAFVATAAFAVIAEVAAFAVAADIDIVVIVFVAKTEAGGIVTPSLAAPKITIVASFAEVAKLGQVEIE